MAKIVETIDDVRLRVLVMETRRRHAAPPPLPASDTNAQRIIATCVEGTWRATVMAPGGARGNGQASSWILAVEAALEDLKEKS